MKITKPVKTKVLKQAVDLTVRVAAPSQPEQLLRLPYTKGSAGSLPEVNRGQWRSKYLLLAYRLLVHSTQPFTALMKSSDGLEDVLNKLFQLVHPEVSYTVQKNDLVFGLVSLSYSFEMLLTKFSRRLITSMNSVPNCGGCAEV